MYVIFLPSEDGNGFQQHRNQDEGLQAIKMMLIFNTEYQPPLLVNSLSYVKYSCF